MAVGVISATLTLDASGFTATLNTASGQVVRFGNQINTTSKAINGIERSLTGLGAKIRHTLVNMALVRTAFHNVWLATGAWQKSILDTAGELERMQFLLKGLSKSTNAEGQVAEAASDFKFLIETAQTAPFTINEITNSFVKMKSVGLEPVDGSMRSLLDAVAKFGGTDETLHRASVAIQQMAGKGVISMEELRQQLGEAVPSAIGMMARSMNMSVGSLVEVISKGQVVAVPALKKLDAQFRVSFGGSAQTMMDTYSGQVSKLKTQWVLFKDEVARSNGLFSQSKKILAELVMVLNPQYLGGVADIYSKLAIGLFTGLRDGIVFIYTYKEEIIALMKVLAVAAVSYQVLTVAARLYNAQLLAQQGLLAVLSLATKTWGAAMASAWAAMRVGSAAMAATAVNAGIVGSAMAALTGGFKAFGAAVTGAFAALKVAFLANPLGWIIGLGAAIAGLVFAFKTLTKSADESRVALARLAENGGYVSEKALIENTERVNAQAEALKKLKQELVDGERRLAGEGIKDWMLIPGANGQNYGDLRRRMAQIRQELAKGGKDLLQDATNLSLVAERAMQQVAERQAAALASDLSADQTRIRASYEAQFTALDKAVDEAKKNPAKLEEIKKQRKELLVKQGEEILGVYEEQMARELKLYETANENEKVAIGERIKTLRDSINQTRAIQEQDIETLMSENTLRAGKTVDAGKDDPLIGYLQSLRQKLAGYKASIEGEGTELSKFLEGLRSKFQKDDGDIGRMTQAQREAYGAELAAKVDEYRKKAADAAKANKEFADAQELVARWTGTTAAETEQLNDVLANGGFELADSRVRQFERTMASLQKTLSPEKFSELADEIKAVQAALQANAAQRQMMDLKEKERVLVQGLQMDKRAAFQEELAQYQARELAQLRVNQTTGAERQRVLEQIELNSKLMEQAFQMSLPIQALAVEWSDTTTAMQEATASWITTAADELTNFFMTGKMNFKAFAKAILSDIMKIIVRAMIAQAILSAIGMMGSGSSVGLGGMNTSSALEGLDFSTNQLMAGRIGFAKGGVMDELGSRSLKRYARGGIARRPQLALFGEGSRPEAYVPLPDGRTIPVTMEGGAGMGSAPNVEVNVINQSGQPVAAQKQGQRFDGRNMILDVVLTAMSQPGSFRDGMRGAVR